MLTGLTTGIKGTGDLGATKGAVVKVASVVASERDALGNALIDDIVADLRKAVYICLPGSEITTLYGIVKKALNRVTIIWVVFGSIMDRIKK